MFHSQITAVDNKVGLVDENSVKTRFPFVLTVHAPKASKGGDETSESVDESNASSSVKKADKSSSGSLKSSKSTLPAVNTTLQLHNVGTLPFCLFLIFFFDVLISILVTCVTEKAQIDSERRHLLVGFLSSDEVVALNGADGKLYVYDASSTHFLPTNILL
jgi:hypothetical protein